MKVRLSIVMAALLPALASSLLTNCKPDGGSNEKITPSAKDAIDFKSLDLAERRTICANHALIVYVGNAESMGTIESSSEFIDQGALKEAQDAKNDVYFNVVKQGGVELYESLKTTQCESSSGSKISLLRIIDGPKSPDSSIEFNQYAFIAKEAAGTEDKENIKVWQEIKSAQKSYKYVKGALLDNSPPKPFELNMPKSLDEIVKGIMKEDENVKGIKKDKLTEPNVSQIIYFIKSHGGLVSTSKREKPAKFYDLVSGALKANATPDQVKHALLFDAHDEDGEGIKSGVFNYMWTKENSCSLLKENTRLFKEMGCDVTSFENCTEEYPSEIIRCTDLYPVEAYSANRQDTRDGGIGQSDGGIGQSDGGIGQSDGGIGQSDGGIGQGGGGIGQGGDSGIGQGGGGIGQGGDGMGQGPGKGMLFLRSPENIPVLNKNKKASETAPDYLKNIGAMATYDWDGDVANHIYKLRLPTPEDAKAPTLIVLDSCYGSSEVFNAVEGKESARLKTAVDGMLKNRSNQNQIVVTLSNEKPTYYYTINYNLLDATGYLAIPHIFYWAETVVPGSTDQIPVIAHSLRAAFLDPTTKDQDYLVRRFGQISHAIGNADESWLKLRPSVHSLEQ